jgi:acetyl esterase/lipase
LKYGYCATVPEVGNIVTLDKVESAISEYDYTMPSDGYFVFYYAHYYIYSLTLKQYVDKLANSGVETFTDTYHIEMFGGYLKSGDVMNGPIRINSSTDESANFFRYLHSGLIEYDASCSSMGILTELGSDETLSIATYAQSRQFLGMVTDIAKIPDGVYFVRLYLANTTAYTEKKVLDVQMTLPYLGIKYVKTGGADLDGCFAFETTYPVVDEIDTDVLTPVVNDERQYDNGHILLPPNYSADGEPVPLIIFCHGTGGLDFNGTYGSYYDYKSYLRDEGYAVADCSGLTNRNWSVTNVFNAPSAMACYEDMYRYIVRNFNIRTDGVYIMGKSAGGFMSILMAHKQPFKIKASAPLCPAISWMASSLTVEAADSIQIAMEQLGFGSRTWTDRIGRSDHFTKWLANYNWEIGGQQGDKPYASTMSSDMQFIMDNLKKLVSYDPLFINSDLDFEAFMEICFDKMALRNSMNSYYVSTTVDGTTYTQEMWQHDQQFRDQLVAMCASAHKYLNVPMKIWEAEDDNETPWGITKMLQSLVQNSGGTLYIRKMPNGHGSHHSVDTGGPMASGTTKFGKAYTDIPVAYVEVADWFDRW